MTEMMMAIAMVIGMRTTLIVLIESFVHLFSLIASSMVLSASL